MEVTKKIISRLRAVAYEELRKNYTKDEWDSIFAGGITVAYLVQMRDHRNKSLQNFTVYDADEYRNNGSLRN